MSSFKKIAWSGSAVLLAVVMSLGVMSQTAFAAAAITTTATYNVSLSTNTASGTNVCSPTGTITLTSGLAADFPGAGVTTITAPGGWTWCTGAFALGTATGAAATVAVATNTMTITHTSVGTGAGTVLITGTLKPDTDTSAGGNITIGATVITGLAAGNVVGTIATTSSSAAYSITTLTVQFPGTTCDATQQGIALPLQPIQVPSDGSTGHVLCAKIVDSSGNPAVGAPVTFSASLGFISATSTTAHSTIAIANSTGFASTTYKGACNCTTSDTVIATFSVKNAIATRSLNLVPGSGGTASKIVLNSPVSLAVAATTNSTTPGYVSPTIGTNVALQVQDAGGLGVNGEVILLTADRGGLIAGFNGACPNNTKAITPTTATGALVVGGTDLKAGVAQFTYCGHQNDAPGKAVLTATNQSHSMAAATVNMSMAGRPASIVAVATGNAILATITDKDKNNVADGTPVRFTIGGNNTGNLSSTCSTTVNGQASTVAALATPTATVLVSTDWNESGATAPSCATAAAVAPFVTATAAGSGSQQITASVNVPGGSATAGSGTPAAAGPGTLTSGSVPATGFGLFVFGGGTCAQMITAAGISNTGAAYATVGGIFVPYIPGTTLAAPNADFMAAYPGCNLPANTAFVGKK